MKQEQSNGHEANMRRTPAPAAGCDGELTDSALDAIVGGVAAPVPSVQPATPLVPRLSNLDTVI